MPDLVECTCASPCSSQCPTSKTHDLQPRSAEPSRSSHGSEMSDLPERQQDVDKTADQLPDPVAEKVSSNAQTFEAEAATAVEKADDSDSRVLRPSSLMSVECECFYSKKETRRKPTTITAASASSKADIFEAKVARAVDEADVSDSDESFVYSDNPPEIPPVSRQTRRTRRRSRRRSRTYAPGQAPSSQADIFEAKVVDALDEADSSDFDGSSVGSHCSGISHPPGSRHKGRLAIFADLSSDALLRRVADGEEGEQRNLKDKFRRSSEYPSLFDDEQHQNQSRNSLRISRKSIRAAKEKRELKFTNRRSFPKSLPQHGSPRHYYIGSGYSQDGYDWDIEDADDEQAPLVGSRRPRPLNKTSPQRKWFTPYCKYVIVIFLALLTIGGGMTFVVMYPIIKFSGKNPSPLSLHYKNYRT